MYSTPWIWMLHRFLVTIRLFIWFTAIYMMIYSFLRTLIFLEFRWWQYFILRTTNCFPFCSFPLIIIKFWLINLGFFFIFLQVGLLCSTKRARSGIRFYRSIKIVTIVRVLSDWTWRGYTHQRASLILVMKFKCVFVVTSIIEHLLLT